MIFALLLAASSLSSVASEFVTLGTGGGPVMRGKRSEPANAVVVGRDVYLFDTGAGTERQLLAAGLALPRVRAIFISHHHIDHNADLGQLLASRWIFNHVQPLPLVGPPGTREMVAGLSAAFRPVELAPIGGPRRPELAATVQARDLASDMDTPTEIYKDEQIRVLAVTNTHYHFDPQSAEARFSRSYSFRIEARDRSYVYTGDTGPSKNVEQLAKGADVLVSEVIDLNAVGRLLKALPNYPPAMLSSMLRHMEEDHLTPAEVGKLAASAGVRQVVLTHLSPGMDDETDLSGYSRGIQPIYQGPVHVARDLDRY
jgi:ribonuclease BN (tRNA processing enzyme)